MANMIDTTVINNNTQRAINCSRFKRKNFPPYTATDPSESTFLTACIARTSGARNTIMLEKKIPPQPRRPEVRPPE